MLNKFLLINFTTCLLLINSFCINASQTEYLQNHSFDSLQKQFDIQIAGLSNTPTGVDSLKLVKESHDKQHTTHTRMQQYFDGFLVFGGYAIMHSADTSKKFSNQTLVTGRVYTGLQNELGQSPKTFMSDANNTLQQFKEQFPESIVNFPEINPIVYIDAMHKAHWAYKMSLLLSYKDKIPEKPTLIIDSTTHETLLKWNDIKTISKTSVLGVGFGGNEKIGQYQFGLDHPFLELTRDLKTKTCFMKNPSIKIINMQNSIEQNTKPMEFPCPTTITQNNLQMVWTGTNADGYDRENGAYSPTNDAMYAGDRIKHFYLDWYGAYVLTNQNGLPLQLVMRVHYGEGFANAYWDGKVMTFGDGSNFMYPLATLSIAAHEVSHGFTQQHSDLNYVGQSGAINEAFSDMASLAIEYYSKGTISWTVGSEIMKKETGITALRYFDKPNRDGKSIDTAANYKDYLDVHHASGVFNHLFYLIAMQPNWDLHKAFDVMVKANMDYWTPYSTFQEGGCGILSAAQDLNYPINDIKKCLTMVAISYKLCE